MAGSPVPSGPVLVAPKHKKKHGPKSSPKSLTTTPKRTSSKASKSSKSSKRNVEPTEEEVVASFLAAVPRPLGAATALLVPTSHKARSATATRSLSVV